MVESVRLRCTAPSRLVPVICRASTPRRCVVVGPSIGSPIGMLLLRAIITSMNAYVSSPTSSIASNSIVTSVVCSSMSIWPAWTPSVLPYARSTTSPPSRLRVWIVWLWKGWLSVCVSSWRRWGRRRKLEWCIRHFRKLPKGPLVAYRQDKLSTNAMS